MNMKNKLNTINILKTTIWIIFAATPTFIITWLFVGNSYIAFLLVIIEIFLFILYETKKNKKETVYEKLKTMFDIDDFNIDDMIIGDQNTNTEECKCVEPTGINNTTNRCLVCNNLKPE